MSDSFFIEGSSTVRQPIRLSSAIAQGAAGTIHRVIGEAGVVVKLYKEPKDLPKYREKIAAMLAAPPHLPAFSSNGRTYVQIAWPTAGVTDGHGQFRGFTMPEVDFQVSTEIENILQRSARQRKHLPEFYGARVLLAANLAALMTELHALGHYMIDMKPMNMRFYPDGWYIAILDTDGFSINGTRRFPAQQFSDEYIAPEARGKKPEQLGLDQDLFALAVIVFRLLNNGIHPFQGTDHRNVQHPTTHQERIFAGLYAYGRAPHPTVGPTLSSIHEYLEDETRELFDQAFRNGAARPTAKEWRDHLNGFVTNKVLVKCAASPNDHAHFSKGCGLCALDRQLSAPRGTVRQQPVQSPASVLNRLPPAPKPFTVKRAAILPICILVGLPLVLAIIGSISNLPLSHSLQPPTLLPHVPALPPHVEMGPDGRPRPADGYSFVDPLSGSLAVKWTPGKLSLRYPHVIAGPNEYFWIPADGYEWLVVPPNGDFRVKWVPGIPSREDPHVVAGKAEGDWHPADGYDWAAPNAPHDFRVKWIPGKPSEQYPHIIAAEIEGEWLPATGYTWVVNPPTHGDFRVKPIDQAPVSPAPTLPQEPPSAGGTDQNQNNEGPPPTTSDTVTRFAAGLADRTIFENWFASLNGDFQSGAEYWASQRSLPNPGSCNSERISQDFVVGCRMARARLTPTDIQRRSDPIYREGWNSYKKSIETPSSSASPTNQAIIMRFATGLADRTIWENWFTSLSGNYRNGADYWAGQRSLPNPESCSSDGVDQDFVAGCQAARVRLAPMDIQRRSDPVYREGWNAYQR
jgi:hypothetical protein